MSSWGHLLVSVAEDGTGRVWDINSRQELRSLPLKGVWEWSCLWVELSCFKCLFLPTCIQSAVKPSPMDQAVAQVVNHFAEDKSD